MSILHSCTAKATQVKKTKSNQTLKNAKQILITTERFSHQSLPSTNLHLMKYNKISGCDIIQTQENFLFQ